MVRALEDVENALVSLSSDRRARNPFRPLPLPLKPRWAGRSRSTTAGRSICCRCWMRNAPVLQRVSPPTTAAPGCCSTACSSTRRWAAAGKFSSQPFNPSPPPPRPLSPQAALLNPKHLHEELP